MILSNLQKTRKSYSKLIRQYAAGEIKDAVQFRNLVYSFSVLLQFWKTEKDIDIEKKLDEICSRIEELE